jgi:hypothetical protein
MPLVQGSRIGCGFGAAELVVAVVWQCCWGGRIHDVLFSGAEGSGSGLCMGNGWGYGQMVRLIR